MTFFKGDNRREGRETLVCVLIWRRGLEVIIIFPQGPYYFNGPQPYLLLFLRSFLAYRGKLTLFCSYFVYLNFYFYFIFISFCFPSDSLRYHLSQILQKAYLDPILKLRSRGNPTKSS